MKKIAFYFHNDPVASVDFSNIRQGNPGVGGTVFLAVLIPTLLNDRGNVDVVLLANQNGIFPKALPVAICDNIQGAFDYCRNKSVDMMVVDNKRISIAAIKRNRDLNFILWANNFIPLGFLKKIEKLNNVKRIVNVSSEQNDLYRDMNVFSKSTFIFNAFPLSPVLQYRMASLETNKREHKVVYVASIVRLKGFHILAKAWPNVLKKIPDAELYVIGTGKLYNKNEKLGKWGVASRSYEKAFMKYLSKNDAVYKSVHFMGEMGIEKYPIIAECKVGVPNPSGKTETFGYTAIEMQAMGCYVTTKMCPGYIDTVYEKNNLYKKESCLADKIIELLNSNQNQPKSILKWIKNNFDCNVVVKRWEDVLLDDWDSQIAHNRLSSTDLNYHNKKLKEYIRLHVPAKWKSILIPVEQFYPSLIGVSYLNKLESATLSLLHIIYKIIRNVYNKIFYSNSTL